MSIGQWTHCIDIMKECFLRIISCIENILFLVVFSQASLWWRLKPHVASQFQAKQRLRPRDGGRCGLVSFSQSCFILRPGSEQARRGCLLGHERSPRLLCVIKLAPTFCPNLQSAPDPTSVNGKPTAAFSPRVSSAPQGRSNQPAIIMQIINQPPPALLQVKDI